MSGTPLSPVYGFSSLHVLVLSVSLYHPATGSIPASLRLPGPHYVVGMSCVHAAQAQIEYGEFLDDAQFTQLSVLTQKYRPTNKILLAIEENQITPREQEKILSAIQHTDVQIIQRKWKEFEHKETLKTQWTNWRQTVRNTRFNTHLTHTHNNHTNTSNGSTTTSSSSTSTSTSSSADVMSIAHESDIPPEWYFPGGMSTGPVLDDSYSKHALCGAIRYLISLVKAISDNTSLLAEQVNLFEDPLPVPLVWLYQSTPTLVTLHPYHLDHILHLDSAALSALNVFPTPTDSDINMSLYGILNQNKTHMGNRLLLRWLFQPSRDIHVIQRRLNYVETFVDDTAVRDAIAEGHLKKFADMDKHIKEIANVSTARDTDKDSESERQREIEKERGRDKKIDTD